MSRRVLWLFDVYCGQLSLFSGWLLCNVSTPEVETAIEYSNADGLLSVIEVSPSSFHDKLFLNLDESAVFSKSLCAQRSDDDKEWGLQIKEAFEKLRQYKSEQRGSKRRRWVTWEQDFYSYVPSLLLLFACHWHHHLWLTMISCSNTCSLEGRTFLFKNGSRSIVKETQRRSFLCLLHQTWLLRLLTSLIQELP